MSKANAEVDAVTLAVVSGVLFSTVNQMTLTMERTARSPVLKLVRDFSSAVFDAEPRMVVQGEDLPVHLGSLMHATKAVAGYFEGDVEPGGRFLPQRPRHRGEPPPGHVHVQARVRR